MISSADNIPDFDPDDTPRFERIRRGGKAIMPTRGGGVLHGKRSKSRSRSDAGRARKFAGAHNRRLKSPRFN